MTHAEGSSNVTLNQTKAADIKPNFVSLGKFQFKAGTDYEVHVDATQVDGNCHIDAIWVVPAE
ncbi:MAG TPA: hypothetical protein DIW81_08250 [Planctomycetaceae bacterium]|nr:hypothetical protein [Planctomycetaceae bacterium]